MCEIGKFVFCLYGHNLVTVGLTAQIHAAFWSASNWDSGLSHVGAGGHSSQNLTLKPLG